MTVASNVPMLVPDSPAHLADVAAAAQAWIDDLAPLALPCP
jgi:hypothetical protein